MPDGDVEEEAGHAKLRDHLEALATESADEPALEVAVGLPRRELGLRQRARLGELEIRAQDADPASGRLLDPDVARP